MTWALRNPPLTNPRPPNPRLGRVPRRARSCPEPARRAYRERDLSHSRKTVTGVAARRSRSPGLFHRAEGITLHRNDVDRFGFVGVHADGKTEIAGQVATHFGPGISPIVAAHNVPVVLHEQHVGVGRMHGEAMDAMARLTFRLRHKIRMKSTVHRLPGFSAIQRAEGSCCGFSDEHPDRIAKVRGAIPA